MKILISAYACLPNAGTEPGNGWGIATNLALRGHEVMVLTQLENQDRIEAGLGEQSVPGLRFYYVDHSLNRLRNDGLRYFLWQWSVVRHARGLQKSYSFDVIHHLTYGSMHVPTQLWRLGIPLVFGPVGGGQIAPTSMLSYFGSGKRTERIRTVLTKMLGHSPFHRFALARMSMILVSNRDTLALAQSLGRGDAQIVFDTLIPDSFVALHPRKFSDHTSPLRILWVGRMVARKALALSLDIVSRVKVPVTLTIIGNGLPRESVWKLITDRGLTDQVQWEDRRQTLEEVRLAYLSHDVLLFNSLRESGGAQLLEAMAQGLPLIALNLHGPGDLIPNDAGIKIDVHSPSQVIRDGAAAIEKFSTLSGEERSRMSLAGWRFSHSLTYSKRAEESEKLYREISGYPVSQREQVATVD